MPKIKWTSRDKFVLAAKNGQDLTDVGLHKDMAGVIKSIDEANRTIDFIISTAGLDRDGDTIDPKGWDLKQYRKNPVVLWAHDQGSPPIGKGVNVRVNSDNELVSSTKFAEYDFADMVFNLYKDGFMNATSVGFMPKDFEIVETEARPWGYDFKEQELLEYSAVPVPSNPEAIMQARAAGLDTAPMVEWAEKILDGEGKLFVPKALVTQLQRAAKGESPKVYVPSEAETLLIRARNAVRSAGFSPDILIGDSTSEETMREYISLSEKNELIEYMHARLKEADEEILKKTEDEFINGQGDGEPVGIMDMSTGDINKDDEGTFSDEPEEKDAEVTKEAQTTGAGGDNNHTHEYDDTESGFTSETDEHVHAVTVNEDNTVEIGMANGHTHDAAAANQPAQEESADDDKAYTKEDLDKAVELTKNAIENAIRAAGIEINIEVATEGAKALDNTSQPTDEALDNTDQTTDEGEEASSKAFLTLLDSPAKEETITLSDDLISAIPDIVKNAMDTALPDAVEKSVRRTKGALPD